MTEKSLCKTRKKQALGCKVDYYSKNDDLKYINITFQEFDLWRH